MNYCGGQSCVQKTFCNQGSIKEGFERHGSIVNYWSRGNTSSPNTTQHYSFCYWTASPIRLDKVKVSVSMQTLESDLTQKH